MGSANVLSIVFNCCSFLRERFRFIYVKIIFLKQSMKQREHNRIKIAKSSIREGKVGR